MLELNKLASRIHKSLYDLVFPEATLITQSSTSAFKGPTRFLSKIHSTKGAEKNEQSLLEAASRTNATLFGDFHTLRPTQDLFLNFCKALHQNGQQIVIALEAFNDRQMPDIQAYLSGSIDASELRARTQFDQSWGFAWAPYQRLLTFARSHQIAIQPLSLSSPIPKALRDSVAADRIASAIERRRNHHVVALMGEHHILHNAVPEKVASRGHLTTKVFSNIDEHFFLNASKSAPETLVHAVTPDTYHLTNCAPWYKWLSALLWYEHRFDADQLSLDPTVIELDDGTEAEDCFDFETFAARLQLILGTALVEFGPKSKIIKAAHLEETERVVSQLQLVEPELDSPSVSLSQLVADIVFRFVHANSDTLLPNKTDHEKTRAIQAIVGHLVWTDETSVNQWIPTSDTTRGLTR